MFYDQNNQKVAEILPGIVLLKNGQKLLEKTCSIESSDYDNWRTKIISKEKIKTSKYSGILIIKEVIASDGKGNYIIWYPYHYYLQKADYVFGIIFYERKLNSGDRKIFEKIIETLKF